MLLLLLSMVKLMMMMPLMAEVAIGARWLENTEKALVVQLRSVEQEFGTAVRDWQGIGRKSRLALFLAKFHELFLQYKWQPE